MLRPSVATVLKSGTLFLLLFALLFFEAVLPLTSSWVYSLLNGVAVLFRDPGTQWLIFLCLVIYLAALIYLSLQARRTLPLNPEGSKTCPPLLAADPGTGGRIAIFWLAGSLLLAIVPYLAEYRPSTEALVFYGGAVIGLGFAWWQGIQNPRQKSNEHADLGLVIFFSLTILLTAASVWKLASGQPMEYHSRARWSGPWLNPNIYGLLMGTGAILAGGRVVQGLAIGLGRSTPEASGKKQVIEKYVVPILCLVAAGFMIRGLSQSYSRGAWCGTLCALIYGGWNVGSGLSLKKQAGAFGSLRSRWRRNWLAACAILVAVVVLGFWHFRQTEWHPARRALSSVNPADFSWRNRIAAWEGALQITAEHPWFGAGWNQPEALYKKYYLPPRLTDSLAIEMNDYLMFGATLGLPAFFCFGMYLWLTLGRSVKIKQMNTETDWLRITCHAGAIVLLVGFWFDGGLFKLPTAATFWILLELERSEPQSVLAEQAS